MSGLPKYQDWPIYCCGSSDCYLCINGDEEYVVVDEENLFEEIEELDTEARNWFGAFRVEAIRRKKKINVEADYRFFRDWLVEMEREFEKICAI